MMVKRRDNQMMVKHLDYQMMVKHLDNQMMVKHLDQQMVRGHQDKIIIITKENHEDQVMIMQINQLSQAQLVLLLMILRARLHQECKCEKSESYNCIINL